MSPPMMADSRGFQSRIVTIVVAPSPGSSLCTARCRRNEWGLKRGCAVALHRQRAPAPVTHDLATDTVNAGNGARQAAHRRGTGLTSRLRLPPNATP